MPDWAILCSEVAYRQRSSVRVRQLQPEAPHTSIRLSLLIAHLYPCVRSIAATRELPEALV